MDELLKKIELEKKKISFALQGKNPHLIFFTEFFKNDDFRDIYTFLSSDKINLATAIILTNHPELDLNFVKQVITANEALFDMSNTDEVENLRTTFNILYNLGLYKPIREALTLGTSIEKIDEIAAYFQKIIECYEIKFQDFALFMSLSEKYFDEIYIALTICASKNEMNEDIYNYVKEVKRLEENHGKALRKKHFVKIIEETLKEKWNIKGLISSLDKPRNYYKKLLAEDKTKQRYYLKLQAGYSKLESEIKKAQATGCEIKDVNKLLAKIEDESIKRSALKVIYQHNKKLCDIASSEYKKLIINSKAKYQILLEKYNFSPEDYNINVIMKNTLEDLEKMLKILSSLEIKDSKSIIRIISNSDLETITTYKLLINSGVITKELLLNHSDLVNKSSKNYKEFMKNLNLINSLKINPLLFSKSQEVLLTPNEIFSLSLETIAQYDLQSQLKANLDYSFLSNKNLANALDTLLELGYEKYLEEDIELLNYVARFKRLILLKSLNMPATTKEEILNVLTTDKFFIADSKMDDYIYSATKYQMLSSNEESEKANISELERFPQTARTYNIGGIYFSKNKVKRNYDNNHDLSLNLLQLLIKDTTLSDEEVNIVSEKLFPSRNLKLIKK